MNKPPDNPVPETADAPRMPGDSPLGTDPDDKMAIGNMAQLFAAMLRQPRRLVYQLHSDSPTRLLGLMLGVTLVCAAAYGVIVGTFSGGTQLWAAPLKVAGGLVFSGLICLPSLYVFSCLSGSRARFVEVAGLVSGLMLLSTLLLIGFAPIAWIFSQSTNSIVVMGAMHIAFAAVSIGFGARFAYQGFRWLETRFGAGLKIWLWIFALVVLQMTSALRPILGTADTLLPTEKKFFLVHWFDEVRTPVR